MMVLVACFFMESLTRGPNPIPPQLSVLEHFMDLLIARVDRMKLTKVTIAGTPKVIT